ncbi:DUF2306 domain-containing protein [Halomonas sp. GT]|uniref:DUF2306 domain-containing protein n=1 Tax=Halomonas sp. GT TaxID=1971364 RepID=UPI0009F46B30|nr:DUF2306 domain-containing protein [Halomonas sp. GT]
MLTLHITSSFLALALGAGILLLAKGTRQHKYAGRVWVLAMVSSAISSFWLGGGVLPVFGQLGPIHLLSVWILWAVFQAIRTARRQEITHHREWIRGAYIGLVVAFVGTLLPGRWVSTQLGLW